MNFEFGKGIDFINYIKMIIWGLKKIMYIINEILMEYRYLFYWNVFR